MFRSRHTTQKPDRKHHIQFAMDRAPSARGLARLKCRKEPKMRQLLTVWAVGAVALCASPSRSEAQATFQGLGDLPGGTVESMARGVSADGSVVVGFSYSELGMEAFRWTQEGGMVGLGDFPGGLFYSFADAVSGDGSIVVGHSKPDGAFRWTQATGMVSLADLSGGIPLGVARDISADGSVVVGYGCSGAGEAFRWTQADGGVCLGDLPGGGFASQAWAVSADGSVVVGKGHSGVASDYEAFRWTQATGMVGLGDLPGGGFWSEATDVSADGSVVVGVGWSDLGPEAFRWTADGGVIGLGELPGGEFFSWARGVSADGSVVVGESRTSLGKEAFIWDATNGIRSLHDVLVNDFGLDLTGWRVWEAFAVSGDGTTVVGLGIYAGHYEAWIATIEAACDPDNLIVQLIALVESLNLQHGIENSLDGKLDAALQALADINTDNDAAAINSLQAFINAVEAQSGHQIPEADASALIEAAQAIVGCLSG